MSTPPISPSEASRHLDNGRRDVFRAIKRGVVGVALGHADQRDAIGRTTRPPTGMFDIIGTGFLVDARGVIATAANVVERLATAVWEANDQGVPAPEPLVIVQTFDAIDPADGQHTTRWVSQYVAGPHVPGSRDVGLLLLAGAPDPALQPLVLSEAFCEEGDEVGVCGFPHGLNLHRNGQITASFAAGIVSAVLPGPACPPTQRERLQLDIQVLDGGNGGPVFDAHTGQVVGVVAGNHSESRRVPVGTTGQVYELAIPLGFSFAEDVAYIRSALQAIRPSSEPPSPAPPAP